MGSKKFRFLLVHTLSLQTIDLLIYRFLPTYLVLSAGAFIPPPEGIGLRLSRLNPV